MENMIEWITPLFLFSGAAIGGLIAMTAARRTAYERAAGELSAQRRLDVVENLSVLLTEVADVVVGADTFKRRPDAEVLSSFDAQLALVKLYLSDELHSLMCTIQAEAVTGGKGERLLEDEFHRAWALLYEAAHGRLPQTHSNRWWFRGGRDAPAIR